MEVTYQSRYNDALQEARDAFRGGPPTRVMQRLYREYALLVTRISNAEATDDVLTTERAERLRQSIREHLARFSVEIEGALGDGARQAADLAVAGHRSGLAAAQQAAGVTVSHSFDTVATRALDQMFVMRGLDVTPEGGLSGSFETLMRRRVRGVAGELDDVLTTGVAQGKSAGRMAQDVAEQLARNDPALKAELRKLTNGRSIASSLHRGNLDAIADTPHMRRLLYDARRIAVSETNNAYDAADKQAAAESPVVSLLKWDLSGRHAGLRSSPDACDLAAEANLYGYGPGLYHPSNCPHLLHPHCACQTRKRLRRPSEWSDPLPQARAPGELSEADVRAYMERRASDRGRSITDAHVRNQRRMLVDKAETADAHRRTEAPSREAVTA